MSEFYFDQKMQLLLYYENARSMSPKSLGNASRLAFAWCQRALTQGRVIPLRSRGDLADVDLRRWKLMGCIHHFCIDTTLGPAGVAYPSWSNNGDFAFNSPGRLEAKEMQIAAVARQLQNATPRGLRNARMFDPRTDAFNASYYAKKSSTVHIGRRRHGVHPTSRPLSTNVQRSQSSRRLSFRPKLVGKRKFVNRTLDRRRCEWTRYGVRLVKLHDEHVNSKCHDRARTAFTNVTILTTMPNVPRDFACLNPVRQLECLHLVENLLALGENARNPRVKRLHVILDFVNGNWEQQYDSEEATHLIRDAIYKGHVLYNDFLDSSVTVSDLEKVTSTVLRRQPSYIDMFQFANNNLDGLVALANADIVFRGLGFLDEEALEWRDITQPLALALSVSKPTGKFGKLCEDMNVDIKGHCDYWGRNYGVSWDAIVFKSPLQATSNRSLNYTALIPPPGGAPAYMNALHAEGCAARFLLDTGYRLHNPCKSIVAEHWHCMGRKMHFSERDGSSRWLGRCSGGINVWGQAGGLGTLC